MPFVSVNCQILSGLHQNWRVFLLVLVHADDRVNNRHGPDQSVLHGIHPGLLHLPVVWWRHVAGAGEETAENVDWSSDLLLPGHHGQVCPTGIYLVVTWTGIYLVFTWSSWPSVSYRYLSSQYLDRYLSCLYLVIMAKCVLQVSIYLVVTWTGIYLVFTWSSWLSVSYRYLSSRYLDRYLSSHYLVIMAKCVLQVSI